MRSIKHQSGMFVIEALISILLFAIGIVALVMMSAQGTNQTVQSKARNDASYLAGELIGELWVTANPNAAVAVSLGGVDLTAWNARVADTMPVGTVPTVSYSGTQVAIDIAWPDTKNAGVFHHYRTASEIAK